MCLVMSHDILSHKGNIFVFKKKTKQKKEKTKKKNVGLCEVSSHFVVSSIILSIMTMKNYELFLTLSSRSRAFLSQLA